MTADYTDLPLFQLDKVATKTLRFDGITYEPKHDLVRLGAQMMRVYSTMRDRQWRTLAEISAITDDPEASISARLRDLRKERFGEHAVERRRRGHAEKGLHEYRLTASREGGHDHRN